MFEYESAVEFIRREDINRELYAACIELSQTDRVATYDASLRLLGLPIVRGGRNPQRRPEPSHLD